MKAKVTKNTICPCGFPLFKDGVGIGTEYEIDENRRLPLNFTCGGCGKSWEVDSVFVTDGNGGFVPAEALDIKAPSPTNKLKKRLMPGVWVDANNNIHVSVPEIIQQMGIEDTPENRDSVRLDIESVLTKGGSKVMNRAHAKCPNCGGIDLLAIADQGEHDFKCMACGSLLMENETKGQA